MNNIAYMKQELERLGVKPELLTDVSIVSLYDNELEETICYASICDKNDLDIFLPYDMHCVRNFFNRLTIEQLNDRVNANTKKRIKKYAIQYAKSRNIVLNVHQDCKPTLDSFNSTLDDYSEYEPDYKVEAFAYTLKKELDSIVHQVYRINMLGE